MALSPEAGTLLKAFRRRQKARPDHWLWGNQSSEAYDELVRIWSEDAVYELAFSGEIDGGEIVHLCSYGGHGGSVKKTDNPRLWNLNRRLRERKDELPGEARHYLEWLERVHGY